MWSWPITMQSKSFVRWSAVWRWKGSWSGRFSFSRRWKSSDTWWSFSDIEAIASSIDYVESQVRAFEYEIKETCEENKVFLLMEKGQWKTYCIMVTNYSGDHCMESDYKIAVIFLLLPIVKLDCKDNRHYSIIRMMLITIIDHCDYHYHHHRHYSRGERPDAVVERAQKGEKPQSSQVAHLIIFYTTATA